MSVNKSHPPLPKEDLEHVLANTRPLWEQLRGGRMFVTGATGFFGVWLLETFAHANRHLELGSELVGLSRNPDEFFKKAPHLKSIDCISIHQGDVRNFVYPSGEFTHVIHAGNPSSLPVPPLEMIDTVIEGSRRVLDFSVLCRAKRFLYISSGAIYGKQPSNMARVPETYLGAPDTLNPASAYGEAKRVGELLCTVYHQEYGLETCIARCFAFVGPHLPLTLGSAMGNFIGNTLKKTPLLIKGDGSPIRSYLYAADLAIWLWTILFKGRAGSAYNVGSANPVSIKNVAKAVAKTVQPEACIVITKPRVPARKSERYVPDVKRAEQELGIQERIPMMKGIQKTSQWNQFNESI